MPFVPKSGRITSVVLGMLALAFLLRVVGQAIVAFFNVRYLPPMPEWHSGLIPYPMLFTIQLVILALQVKVSHDIWWNTGFFAKRRPRAGRFLRRISYVYFAAMVVRYVVSMWLYPERRWFGKSIPILFHFVLAAYLFVLGRYLKRGDDQS